MNTKISMMLTGVLSLLVLSLETLAVDLVKDGKSNAVIVLPVSMSGAEGYAAVELSMYLQKITGAQIEIKNNPVPGICNIYLGTTASQMPDEISKQYYRLKNDGFMLITQKDAMYVISRVPIGVVYGAYEILKRFGDVRWFYPGADGEYVPQKSTFSVPEGVISVNPTFTKRSFNLTGGPQNYRALPTMQWMLRNNMTGAIGCGLFADRKSCGGHDWYTLLPKELFKTKPELFPMVAGERHVTSWKANDPGYANPCISNPEGMEIMQDSVIKKINADRKITTYELLQNDTMQWCECENCKKLDSPSDFINHSVSNRFWIFANALIKKIKDNAPSVEITAWAYINAENPPDMVKPDTRCNLRYCMVRRCHIHSLQDESCAINRNFRKRLEDWRKLDMPIWTYEYSSFVPQGSRISAPFEKIHSEDMKYYKKIGLIGYCDERAPIVSEPEKYFIKDYIAGGKGSMAYSWYYDVIPRYFQAYYMWNTDAAFDTVMEDFGSKFYGKAWPEMKEYRTLLRSCYEKAPTHFMYGTPSIAAGRILDNASEKFLAEKLENALAAAAGDKVVGERIMRDKEVFEGLVAKRKAYQEIQKMRITLASVKASPTEQDWAAASAVTDFTNMGKAASQKTSAKVLYDSKNIYFRIEAFEDKMNAVAARETQRDGVIWNDSTIEIFITPPAFGGKYLHFIVNPNGVIFDALTVHPSDSDKSFDAKADVKVTKLSDRWIADIAIPFDALGGAPKSGDEWKINVARGRVLADGTKSESSSWSNGEFHGVDMHRSSIFGK